MAMVDLIEITENLEGVEGLPLHWEFIELTLKHPPSERAGITAVVRYVDWLIDNARMRNLEPSVILKIVRRLMVEEETVARRLLLACRLNRINNIEFAREYWHHHIDAPCSRRLLDMLGECGYLSESEVSFLLINSAPTPDLADHVWRTVLYKSPPPEESENIALRTVIDLTKYGVITTTMSECLKTIISSEDSITRYIPLFICYPLRNSSTSNNSLVSLLIGLINWRRITSSSIIWMITQALCGAGTADHMNMIPRDELSTEHQRAFINGANETLRTTVMDISIKHSYTQATTLKKMYERCADIITVLGDGTVIEEDQFKIVELNKKFSFRLRGVLLSEARKRGMIELGDKCLANCINDIARSGVHTFLVEHQDSIGEISAGTIMRTSCWLAPWTEFLSPKNVEKITDYASTHRKEYIMSILYKFHDGRCYSLGDINQQGIRLNNSMTISLGNRVYTRTYVTLSSREEDTLSFEDKCKSLLLNLQEPKTPQKKATCTKCHGELSSILYADDREGRFGQYYCAPCGEDTIFHRVYCQVCMDEDSQKNMTVIQCGHAFCNDCLARIIADSDDLEGRCPVCREYIDGRPRKPKVPKRVSVYDAVEEFLHEHRD